MTPGVWGWGWVGVRGWVGCGGCLLLAAGVKGQDGCVCVCRALVEAALGVRCSSCAACYTAMDEEGDFVCVCV